MRERAFPLLPFIFLTFLFLPSKGSVRLVYPPSRDFNDELTTENSDPPCGIYSTKSTPVTNLLAGSVLNVSWSLTYAHTGGFKIQLLQPFRSVAIPKRSLFFALMMSCAWILQLWFAKNESVNSDNSGDEWLNS